jgi:predicted RNase H-like HicB family nuclease
MHRYIRRISNVQSNEPNHEQTSDHYVKVVAWSEEDQCYIGCCPGLMLGGLHGSDEQAVYAELCQAVEEWTQLYESEGRPLPVPTSLREIEALV